MSLHHRGRLRWCFGLAVVLTAVGVPPSHAQPRIVNGTPTASYPSAGIIQTPIGLCSGVLVGCQTFLTAAHCFCDTVPGAACAADPAAVDASATIVFLQHYGFMEASSVSVHPDYSFGTGSLSTADLAVVRLAAPASGVGPSAPAGAAPTAGSAATIVGFGSTGVVGGDAVGTGVKREGPVVTEGCDDGLVCWEFSGSGSNTCFGDSGGPLFIGALATVAGITSGGTSDTCSAGDLSFDTDVASYAAWIESVAGEPLGSGGCGGLASAGETGTTVLARTGSWDETSQSVVSFGVSAGTTRLRVTTNGTLEGDADLFLRAGAAPTATTFDCAGRNGSAFEACEVTSPAAGDWYALVEGVTAAGDYQLTVTTFDGAASVCGNGVRESGEECDGTIGPVCEGRCSAACACIACDAAAFTVRAARLTPRLRIRGTLAGAAYDDVDPRQGFALVMRDGSGNRIALEVAAGDPGWKRRRHGFGWRGTAGGLRHVALRKRSGTWKVAIAGGDVAGAGLLDPSTLDISLSAGAQCAASG